MYAQWFIIAFVEMQHASRVLVRAVPAALVHSLGGDKNLELEEESSFPSSGQTKRALFLILLRK